MPSMKSARVAERRRQRNAPLRSRAKTFVTRARQRIDAGGQEDVDKAVTDAVVALDKAAQKGALHRRNAARRKSRLMKRSNSARG